MDPLENQQSLSSAEKSLQPLNKFLIFFILLSYNTPLFQFPSLYYVWFYPTSWGYAISGSWSSWQYCETDPSRGLRVKLDRSLLANPTSTAPSLPQHILQEGQIVGQSICDWLGVSIAPLEALPGYRRWLVQAPYPPLLGSSS